MPALENWEANVYNAAPRTANTQLGTLAVSNVRIDLPPDFKVYSLTAPHYPFEKAIQEHFGSEDQSHKLKSKASIFNYMRCCKQ